MSQTDPKLVRLAQLIAELELRMADLRPASTTKGTGLLNSAELLRLSQETLESLQVRKQYLLGGNR